MRTMMRATFGLALVWLLGAAGASRAEEPPGAPPPTEEERAREAERASLRKKARAVFDALVAKEKAFDPRGLELIADDAEVQQLRTLGGGSLHTMRLTGKAYKAQTRAALKKARKKGPRPGYREVQVFLDEYPPLARIEAMRVLSPKAPPTSYVLWVGPDARGKWLVRKLVMRSE